MIEKTAAVAAVLARLEKLPVGHYLELRTYKRNRAVLIVKETAERLRVVEKGFVEDEFTVPPEELRALLRSLLKKEFPRSHQVRLYVMDEYRPAAAALLRRKKI